MNIITFIDQVVKQHKNHIIQNFYYKRKTIDEAKFEELYIEAGKNLREIYFDYEVKGTNGLPYQVNMYKMAYLAKFVPTMFHSITQLILSRWDKAKFNSWINGKDRLGICSLGSGPGSDVFGAIWAINNKANHGKKIKYLVRYELDPTWEHYYKSLKKEIIESNVPNVDTYLNPAVESPTNRNERISEVLKLCYDEWLCVDTEKWAKTHSFSKCDILLLQHVVSDPSSKENLELIIDNILLVLFFLKKPGIVIISDLNNKNVAENIIKIFERIAEKYEINEILKPSELEVNHHQMTYPDFYVKTKTTQMKYNHLQTIWGISSKKE